MGNWLTVVESSSGSSGQNIQRTLQATSRNNGRNPRSKRVQISSPNAQTVYADVSQRGRGSFIEIETQANDTISVANNNYQATQVTITGRSNAESLQIVLGNGTHFHLRQNQDVSFQQDNQTRQSIGTFLLQNSVVTPNDDPGKDDSYRFSLTIEVDANSTVSAITDTITITDPDNPSVSDSATLSHAAGDAFIRITGQPGIIANDEGSTATIIFETNENWQINITEVPNVVNPTPTPSE